MTSFVRAPFGDVFADVTAGNPKLKATEYLRIGNYPVIDQGERQIAGFTNNESNLAQVSGPVILFGDHTRVFKYVDRPFALGADGVKVLRPKIQADPRYLFHFLKSSHIPSAGYSRHFKFLKELTVPLPPLEEQRRITAILDKFDELRAARRRTLELLDAVDRSAFNKVFGNAVVPLNDWELKPLRTLGVITTGNTPPRSDASNYGKHIEWIKSDNIRPDQTYVATANEMLSESGAKKARIVEAGSVLVTCIAGSPKTIGNAAIANRPIAFNQQINAFTPNEGPALFWRGLLRAAQPVVQAASTGGMTGMVSKSAFGSIAVIDAPLDVQAQYAEKSAHIEAARFAHSAQLAKLERLFASLQYRAFAGEL